ncbi:copper chaperone PCu(A)C [Nesterenkonia natronophila]|nr:copper chaperone PCu(A)C [Nesterenkonia natronophila]
MKNSSCKITVLCAASLVAVTACNTDTSPQEGPDQGPTEEGGADTRIHSENDDLWVRSAGSGMTSVFGTLENLTDDDLEIVAAETPVAESVELHEIILDDDGQEAMQEIEGGFLIPADAALEMEPGGDHLMLMGLHHELPPGELVEFTLEFEDGSAETIEAIVKDDGGQDEPYESDDHGDQNDH